MAKRKLESEVVSIISLIKNKKHFLLNGGAGSGKTYSLVCLLKEISSLYPKARIACITYTNAAAVEIKNRSHIENLQVTTIHEFLWMNISQFQNELRDVLVELVNDKDGGITNPNQDTFTLSSDIIIQYKEHTRLAYGEISHDEVIKISKVMFARYSKLCKIVCSKYPYIFVDEYQDTSPQVIDILLKSLQSVSNPSIIGFFGDSMQAIYDEGVGDIDDFISEGIVNKIEKKQNRRNPSKVIELGNKLRTDGLIQVPSEDADAPNMKNGIIKDGTVSFFYGSNFTNIYSHPLLESWNFQDPLLTKELRLTHNLIADEAKFDELLKIYDSDPILKLKNEFKKYIEKKSIEVDNEKSFGEVLESTNWIYEKGKNKGKSYLEVLLSNEENHELYSYVKDKPYSTISRMYWDKDELLDDKVEIDGSVVKDVKRDAFVKYLFKIQSIIIMYEQKNYKDLLKILERQIHSNADKKSIYKILEGLLDVQYKSVGEVIEYANNKNICVKDDSFNKFVEKNEYLYWRISNLQFKVVQNLFYYLEGRRVFSTQHKIKGLEYNNVLVVLDNGWWNKYNFEYVFDDSIFDKLNVAKKKTYPKIKQRTEKIFYVCCTRAKENLAVFYPNPSQGVVQGAKRLFGEKNCYNIDCIIESNSY